MENYNQHPHVKTCMICMELKSADEFGTHHMSRDGLKSRCNACVAVIKATHKKRAGRKVMQAEYSRKYYAKKKAMRAAESEKALVKVLEVKEEPLAPASTQSERPPHWSDLILPLLTIAAFIITIVVIILVPWR